MFSFVTSIYNWWYKMPSEPAPLPSQLNITIHNSENEEKFKKPDAYKNTKNSQTLPLV
jgi:hypothetical protein